MKKIALAAALAATVASTASAGTYGEVVIIEPVIQPEVVVEEAASSSNAGLIVPLMALLLIAVAVQ